MPNDEAEVPAQGAEPPSMQALRDICDKAGGSITWPWPMEDHEAQAIVDYVASLREQRDRWEGLSQMQDQALTEITKQLAAAKQERDNSLSSDFAGVWHAYVDVADSELTADAIALKDRLIAVVQDSPWFSDYEHAHEKLSEVMRIEAERDDLKSKLEQARAEPERWQSIETAPKDGSRILLASAPSMGMGPDGPVPCGPTSHIGYWNPDGSAWVDECGSFDGDADHLENTGIWNSRSGWFQPNEVTHWMSLPKPPAIDSARAQGKSAKEEG